MKRLALGTFFTALGVQFLAFRWLWLQALSIFPAAEYLPAAAALLRFQLATLEACGRTLLLGGLWVLVNRRVIELTRQPTPRVAREAQ